ncbi:MAG: preprotein translocase subunit SecG [Desulfobacterales bacterium]|nr:preprotein translocase subunit SecG [Desulfobacterales bacterium]
MSIFIVIIHVIVSIALIMIVLLQTGKGADMGAAFGGGSSQSFFGTTGASTFLSKATTVAAIVFMLTSLSLAYTSGHKRGNSIMKQIPAPVEQPVSSPLPDKNTATPQDAPTPEKSPQ